MNIVISGYGMMGQQLMQLLDETHHEVYVVDYQMDGADTFDDIPKDADVIIDFSHPSVLNELLSYAKNNKVAVVLATTGYAQTQLEQIKAASLEIPLLHTSNTSYGIQVLLKAVNQLDHLLPDADVEIVEHHHNKKVDAPSGTANMILQEVTGAPVYGRQGNQKRNLYEVGVHSVRGGSVAGYHEVNFFLNGEQITISHRAESKVVFAEGALKAAFFIVDQEPGYYTMKEVLED